MLSATETTAGPATAAAFEETLWTVYRSALDRFLPLQDGIVARSLTADASGWKLTEPSPLNTAEVVRALFLLEAQGLPISGWNPRAMLERLVNAHLQKGDVQVTALTLWAAASGNDRSADDVFARLRDHIETCSQSMTLAWAISASCAYSRLPGRQDAGHQLAQHLLERLFGNQNPRSSLFHPSGKRSGLMRRKPIETTLSSQTYPILAIATYARTFGDPTTLAKAQRCADVLTRLQGPRGQWWWRYNAVTGVVADGYPVYAVNQDSAVPAAFRSLQDQLGGTPYEAAIGRGLDWLHGLNEVQQSLLGPGEQLVARSITKSGETFDIDRELYSYQPARYIAARLSRPTAQTRRA